MNILKSIFQLSVLFTVLMVSSCQSKNKKQRYTSNLSTSTIQKVDAAHKATEFYNHECVAFDLKLIFGGKEAFKGRVYSMTNSSAIRLDYENGKKLLIRDGDIYTNANPVAAQKMGDKFALFTWQYFFMVPFKLADPGTNWKQIADIKIENKTHQSELLTFDQGIGDAPDDWYIIHPDPSTNLISHMGYIVTAGGTDPKAAENNAHAISYKEYKSVQGIPFSHKWIISDYTKGIGLGKQIGEATVTHIKLESAKDIFDPSSDLFFLKYD